MPITRGQRESVPAYKRRLEWQLDVIEGEIKRKRKAATRLEQRARKIADKIADLDKEDS